MDKFQQRPQMFTNMENWRLHNTYYVPLMPLTPRHMVIDGNEIDHDGRPNVSLMDQFFAKSEADEWKPIENFRWSMAPTVAQGMTFEHKDQVIAEVNYRPMSVNGFPKQYKPDLAASYLNPTQTCMTCPKGTQDPNRKLCRACIIYAFERKFQLRKILDHLAMYRKWMGILQEVDEHGEQKTSIHLVDLYARLAWLGERKAWIESEVESFLAVEDVLEARRRLSHSAIEEGRRRAKKDAAERLERQKVKSCKNVAQPFPRQIEIFRASF